MSISCQRYLVASARRDALERDAHVGLASAPKSLPPVWFYDERGSALFEAITELPEYYLTRAERNILSEHGHEIAERAGCDTLVELGSGNSQKTWLLLDAMGAQGLDHFVALDVSEEILVGSANSVHTDYGVDVTAIVGDFHHHLATLPARGRRLVAFLGSTVGNFEPTVRRRFLHNVAARQWHQVTASCSAPTCARTRTGLFVRTTTPRESLLSSTATFCTCSTMSWAPTLPRSASSTSAYGTIPRAASKCGCERYSPNI